MALSILADYFGEHPTTEQIKSGAHDFRCQRWHQQFMWAFIAPLLASRTIEADQITAWLVSQGVQVEVKSRLYHTTH